MAGRSDELHAEPRQIEDDVSERHELGFAPAAAPGDDRPEPQRPPEEPPHPPVERARELDLAGRGHETIPRRCSPSDTRA